MIFWRIFDNQVFAVQDVDKLGFSVEEGLRIPDEYLENGEFTVMRTCHGIGDWGIISAMPRLLKEKYPNCRVYVPSAKLLERLFGGLEQNWSSWDNPFINSELIFKNNPYVDGFKDYIAGDVFTDHYRVYDENNLAVPLVEQMLKFWQFEPHEYEDSQPELYWSDEEKELGDKIIKEHVGDSEFGSLVISNRYDYTQDRLIHGVLRKNDIPYFYYTAKPIELTDFNYIKKGLDIHHVDPRIQLYIRSKAKVNISNQSGVTDILARYSDVYEIQRQIPHKHNFIRGINYLVDTYKREVLFGVLDKYISKTTTSLKWKSDVIDFFNDEQYKDCVALEVGSSLGATTSVLSSLFKKVIAVDNLSERHAKSKSTYNRNNDNIEYVTMDVYSKPWDFGHVDIVIIDCIHDYKHVKLDIENAIRNFDNPILVFDDYGLFPEIKKAIDEYVEEGVLEVAQYIGHPMGNVFPKTKYKVLKDTEGVICYVSKKID